MVKLVLEEGYKRQTTINDNSRPCTCILMNQSSTTVQYVKCSTKLGKFKHVNRPTCPLRKETASQRKAQRNLPAATSRTVKLNYEEVAVFPLVKPRSCLNVKFRCSMISTLRSNFPAYRPGVTQWVHPRVPHEWGVHT